MWDSVDAAVAFAAMILGIRDTTNVTDEQVAQMKEVLIRQKALLRSYWAVETDGEAMMSSGEVVASYFWSGPVYRLQEAGIPVEYIMDPKGGIISWACGLVMTNNGEGDEQAAYDFINAWNSPEAGKFLIEVYGYGHSNLLTYDIVDPEILKTMGLDGDIAEFWPPRCRGSRGHPTSWTATSRCTRRSNSPFKRLQPNERNCHEQSSRRSNTRGVVFCNPARP